VTTLPGFTTEARSLQSRKLSISTYGSALSVSLSRIWRGSRLQTFFTSFGELCRAEAMLGPLWQTWTPQPGAAVLHSFRRLSLPEGTVDTAHPTGSRGGHVPVHPDDFSAFSVFSVPSVVNEPGSRMG
jgi:hypothetical protein